MTQVPVPSMVRAERPLPALISSVVRPARKTLVTELLAVSANAGVAPERAIFASALKVSPPAPTAVVIPAESARVKLRVLMVVVAPVNSSTAPAPS